MWSSDKYAVWSVVGVWTVCQLVLGTSVKLELAYHSREAAWNTASNVCRENGGQLVKISTSAKSKVVRHFHQNSPNGDFRDTDFWIGLFDGDIPNQAYSWKDCSLLSEGTFKNWYIGRFNTEPNSPDSDYCIRCANQGYTWKTKECDAEYHFVCEKPVGECTFSRLERKAIKSSTAYTTTDLPGTYPSFADCQAKCVGADNSESECWAVTYITTGSEAGSCSLHLSDDPTQLMSPPTSDDNDVTSSVRMCYEAVYNSNSIPNTLKDTSSIPEPCKDTTPQLSEAISEAVDVSASQTTSQAITEVLSVTARTVEGSTESPTNSGTTSESEISSNIEMQSTATSHESSSATKTTSNQRPSVTEDGTRSTTNGVPVTTESLASDATGTQLFQCPDEGCTTGSAGQVVASTESDPAVASTESLCRCPCGSTLTPAQSEKLISSILQDLVVEKKNISSYKRKYVSAPDPRPSAQTIGYFGVVLLALVFGGLTLLDLPRFLETMKSVLHYLREK